MLESLHLFQQGVFELHSGDTSKFKIECGALTKPDWDTLAQIVTAKLKFSYVIGVPTGGLMFAESLKPYTSDGNYPWLIVDDVLTTGGSMEEAKNTFVESVMEIRGIVLFARQKTPDWIESIFQMW